MTETITVTAVFHPQAWINDYAVDIDDGVCEFDVTLTLEQARELLAKGDQSTLADNVWEDSPLYKEVNHPGPFWVEVCEAIEEALEELEEVE